uniref:Uncharacterized protein n=1 Tax=Trichogramma kaykai TaxID=54128 RepID=A0ABD2WFL5_9HYME
MHETPRTPASFCGRNEVNEQLRNDTEVTEYHPISLAPVFVYIHARMYKKIYRAIGAKLCDGFEYEFLNQTSYDNFVYIFVN